MYGKMSTVSSASIISSRRLWTNMAVTAILRGHAMKVESPSVPFALLLLGRCCVVDVGDEIILCSVLLWDDGCHDDDTGTLLRQGYETKAGPTLKPSLRQQQSNSTSSSDWRRSRDIVK